MIFLKKYIKIWYFLYMYVYVTKGANLLLKKKKKKKKKKKDDILPQKYT